MCIGVSDINVYHNTITKELCNLIMLQTSSQGCVSMTVVEALWSTWRSTPQKRHLRLKLRVLFKVALKVGARRPVRQEAPSSF